MSTWVSSWGMYSLQNYYAFLAFAFQKHENKEEKIGCKVEWKKKENSFNKCEVIMLHVPASTSVSIENGITSSANISVELEANLIRMLITYFCSISKLKLILNASFNAHVWHVHELWSSAWQLERCWCDMKNLCRLCYIYLLFNSFCNSSRNFVLSSEIFGFCWWYLNKERYLNKQKDGTIIMLLILNV